MIKFTVKEAAEQAGINNPHKLEEKTGLTYATCNGLWKNIASQIHIKTLDKLCNSLDAEVKDLIRYIPD